MIILRRVLLFLLAILGLAGLAYLFNDLRKKKKVHASKFTSLLALSTSHDSTSLADAADTTSQSDMKAQLMGVVENSTKCCQRSCRELCRLVSSVTVSV